MKSVAWEVLRRGVRDWVYSELIAAQMYSLLQKSIKPDPVSPYVSAAMSKLTDADEVILYLPTGASSHMPTEQQRRCLRLMGRGLCLMGRGL